MFNKPSVTGSKDIAKDRLKLVLVNDRTQSNPQIIEMIKNDIIEVISKYMDIEDADISFVPTKDESGEQIPILVANISISGIK